MTKLDIAIIVASMAMSAGAHGEACRAALRDIKRENHIDQETYREAKGLVINDIGLCQE